ncbi:MAG: C40 family peptidase [Prevotella sp.]|jgi:SH3-like domain-containing protein|nr:C40 family peptidase [Prevotella sp.]
MKERFLTGCWLLAFLCAILFAACHQQKNSNFTALIEAVGAKYAPDSRDEVYEITTVECGGRTELRGATTVAAAKAELLQRARQQKKAWALHDRITVLPDSSLNGKTFGIVNVSVADARLFPAYGAEMGTQYLLGSPVTVLQKQDEWLRVRGSDGYLAWMLESNLTAFDRQAFEQRNAATKVIFTDFFGFSYAKPDVHSQHVSDLVFGNMLELTDVSGSFYKVVYPDGREAYILQTQSRRYADWLKMAEQTLTGKNVCTNALKLMGIPYSWGGTSVKGMDCSGFVKTVYLMHGIVLRRDASQQAKTGIAVALTDNYENLQAGDLLFFGKKAKDGKRERIRHVAIYLGGRKFIHANGCIKISSLDPSQPDYDAYNTSELLRATRIIGAVGTDGIWQIGKTIN